VGEPIVGSPSWSGVALGCGKIPASTSDPMWGCLLGWVDPICDRVAMERGMLADVGPTASR
jgi:hypothetical protein